MTKARFNDPSRPMGRKIFFVIAIIALPALLGPMIYSLIFPQVARYIHAVRIGVHRTIPESNQRPFDTFTVFDDHEEFQSIAPETDAVWKNVLTPNGGMLFTTDASGRSVKYGISMFHQLHCLQLIRARLQSHELGRKEDRDGGHHNHMDKDHVLHCLDYIRQGILCCADGSFEKQKVSKSTGSTIAGYKGVTHVCRNAEELYALSLGGDTWLG